jgi:hypothetical protein
MEWSMHHDEFEKLVLSAAEIERIESPTATHAARPDCVPMARLEEVASGQVSISAAEWRHVTDCRICAHRLRGFEQLAGDHRFLRIKHPSRQRWSIRAASIAAAACLGLLFVSQFSTNSGPGSHMRPGAADTPHAGVIGAGSTAVPRDYYHVLALTQQWSHDCGCPTWRLQAVDTGHTICGMDLRNMAARLPDVRALLDADDIVVFVIATSPDMLPMHQEDAGSLFSCMLDAECPADIMSESTSLAAAIQDCLPDGVMVVSGMPATE